MSGDTLAVAEYLVTLVKTRNQCDGRKIRLTLYLLPTCQDLPLKNAFAIVTLSALLSACAVAPQKQDDAVAGPAAVPAPAADSAAPLAAAAAETLPGVELTSDLLYRITKAELEFKRGQWQGAYITMLSLAQQTRDPLVAQPGAGVGRGDPVLPWLRGGQR